MNNHIKIARLAVISLGIIGIISLIHALFITVFAIRYITYDFDERLSRQARIAIVSYIESCCCEGRYNPAAILAELPEHCTCIKSVALLQLPHHTAQLRVISFDPIVTVNNDKMLIENNAVISAAYYADFVKNSLHKVTLANEVPAAFSVALTSSIREAIEEKLFDHYTFNIISHDQWHLQDKNDPAFTICCNAASMPHGALYQKYSQLKKKLRTKESMKAAWIADIRFNNQIIVAMSTRGHYGKGVQ